MTLRIRVYLLNTNKYDNYEYEDVLQEVSLSNTAVEDLNISIKF
jgi:hypothetical protein